MSKAKRHEVGRCFYWPAFVSGLAYTRLVAGSTAQYGIGKLIWLGYTLKYPMLLGGMAGLYLFKP
jgi:hypothetical protein